MESIRHKYFPWHGTDIENVKTSFPHKLSLAKSRATHNIPENI